MAFRAWLLTGTFAVLLLIPAWAQQGERHEPPIRKIHLSEKDWKRRLTSVQFQVLRQKGTEQPYKGAYWDNHKAGTYLCAGCGLEVFRSTEKFDSGTGWPSFWQPATKNHIKEEEDHSLDTVRTEVECARCGGHLGHVFDDGPQPTGLRYCINSAAIKFQPVSRK